MITAIIDVEKRKVTSICLWIVQTKGNFRVLQSGKMLQTSVCNAVNCVWRNIHACVYEVDKTNSKINIFLWDAFDNVHNLFAELIVVLLEKGVDWHHFFSFRKMIEHSKNEITTTERIFTQFFNSLRFFNFYLCLL